MCIILIAFCHGPDGTCVDMGVERFQLSELMFDPLCLSALDVVGSDVSSWKGIPRLVCDATMRCESDSQQSLLSNIVVSGGAATFDGLPDRLRLEVEQMIHVSAPGWRVKSMSPGLSERPIAAWLGGSILASLGTFHEVSVY